MKKIIEIFSLTLLSIFLFSGCENEKPVYDGPDYIMFSDSLYLIPVEQNDEFIEIPISATRSCSYDRTVAVEIIDKESNAIEGVHYEIESNTVTIPAGELATSFKVRGHYENVGVEDSLGFHIRLLVDKAHQWDVYGVDADVVMQKVCPFDIHDFEGWCTITSSYINQYMKETDMRLIRTEVDPEEENTIIMKNYFYDGYDVKIKFLTEDPLRPDIEMEDQVFGPTSIPFEYVWGDGTIRMYQPPMYTSYYSTCEHFIFQFMTLYVETVGTVGTFFNAVKWISDDEAEKLKREGY